MYKTIYIPVDNSDHSNTAVDVGVHFAKAFGSKIVGSHVYAAKMHDKRFKQMEAGLPEEYHDEKELDRQRQIHDSLITRGLQIITDSYLDYVDKKCNEANLPIERRSLEGRNWKVLAEDINTNAYDLVIMGALGVGAVKDSVIGSNTERVLRRVRNSDMLIIKNTQPMTGGKIVVAVDGSPYSFGGLMTGLALGKAFNMPVEAISAFDPYFHYAAFHSISGVLNEEAGKVFRFKEQEKLHEEIIDSGLAKIYQSHLDISREIAQAEQTDVKTTLLDGKAFEKIIQYVRKDIPALLIVGRIGVHSDEDMDIGSNTENLLRSAPCNVLVSNRKYVPPIDTQAEYTIAWTEEALRRMEKIPVFATRRRQDRDSSLCHRKGPYDHQQHRRRCSRRPHSSQGRDGRHARTGWQPGRRRHRPGQDAGRRFGGEGSHGLDAQRHDDRDRGRKAESQCRHSGLPGPDEPELLRLRRLRLHRQGRDAREMPGLRRRRRPLQTGRQEHLRSGGAKPKASLETDLAYDDVPMQWTKDAKEAIRAVPAGFQRRRAKAKIEKTARKLGMTTITLEYAAPMIKEAASEDYHPDLCEQGNRRLSRSAEPTWPLRTNGTTR